jgi:hypothetical protein
VAGYLILFGFVVVAVALAVHVRRTKPLPPRRPFDSDENSLIGESKKSSFVVRDPGGRGGNPML